MNLANGEEVTCSRVTEIPITESVIKAVEALAEKQGFKSLKIKNRHGVVLWDSAWTAGVDYEAEDEDEEYYVDPDEYYNYDEEEDDEPDDLDDEDYEDIEQDEIDDI